jgi:hypothetical protein
MVTTGSAYGLLDRDAEREVDYAIDSASGFRIVRAVGVEPDMELPFAALQQLCAPMIGRLERLPGPQRDALGVAFGLTAGEPPDRTWSSGPSRKRTGIRWRCWRCREA